MLRNEKKKRFSTVNNWRHFQENILMFDKNLFVFCSIGRVMNVCEVKEKTAFVLKHCQGWKSLRPFQQPGDSCELTWVDSAVPVTAGSVSAKCNIRIAQSRSATLEFNSHDECREKGYVALHSGANQQFSNGADKIPKTMQIRLQLLIDTFIMNEKDAPALLTTQFNCKNSPDRMNYINWIELEWVNCSSQTKYSQFPGGEREGEEKMRRGAEA